MKAEKISTRKISEIVAEKIENMIEEGSFAAGEKLPSVRELCEAFGVGRSAVRDAMAALQGKGLVHVKQGEGTYILGFDSSKLFTRSHLLPGIKDIQELFQARKMVEAGLAEMAALNRTELNVEKMNHLLTNPTAEGWESDYLFHLAIAEAAGNTIMIHFIEFISTTLKKSMVDFHQFIQSQPAIVQTINEQHFTIFRAIEEKDANQAHNLMIEHLSFVEELLQKRIFQQY
ncbi:FadR/GntR family transcriptional regulator [Cytobacillus purgationiresistens]|uniref:GntR family transcriptional repressor for pyruvate dehydrogenase complex n=1 Tax=Cytobacillus purgationiresistens TaxID=863449 RepID=A0ABU0AM31_9BACI|nr:FadR/GntR family transcriptional regulator [Cytobacillus purgationiresistens]MDQ0272323.1 GntR family transcriptional repressor for pyruvate dehydrogenase complex [Cytobacillus purgationiresistens]